MRSTPERIDLYTAVDRAVFCSVRSLFVLVLLCLSLVSCAKKEVLRRAELEPYKGPVTVDVLKRSVGFGDVRSIKALADVAITKKGKREGSLNGVFGYKAPGKIRINLFGPFGLTVTEILISNELLQLSVPAKNTLYEWNSPEVSFTGLMNNRFNYRMTEEDDGYVLLADKVDDEVSDIAVKYFFDKTYLLNRVISFWKDGAEEVRAEFYVFNGRVPEQTRLSFSNGLSINVALQETEFDSVIPDEYFRIIEHGDKEIRPFQEVFKRFAPSR